MVQALGVLSANKSFLLPVASVRAYVSNVVAAMIAEKYRREVEQDGVERIITKSMVQKSTKDTEPVKFSFGYS